MTLGMEKLVEVTAVVELGALLANRELAPVISELKENICYFQIGKRNRFNISHLRPGRAARLLSMLDCISINLRRSISSSILE